MARTSLEDLITSNEDDYTEDGKGKNHPNIFIETEKHALRKNQKPGCVDMGCEHRPADWAHTSWPDEGYMIFANGGSASRDKIASVDWENASSDPANVADTICYNI